MNDIIKAHTVVVDGGSGVLIQPMTDEYSYILTAKHVVQHDEKKPELGIKAAADIKIQRFSGEALQARQIYHHGTLDIAVIRIDFTPDLSITPHQKAIGKSDLVSLYGYPNYSPEHRNEDHKLSDWIDTYDLRVMDADDRKLVFRNEETAQQSDIKGFSGGGLFYIIKDLVYLIGIEHSVTKPAEYADRVLGCPIASFNEVLNAHQLALLKPLHLSSFKHLTNKVFPQRYYDHLASFKWRKFDHVIDILKRIVNDGVGDIMLSPEIILKENQQALKVKNQDLLALEDEKLWSAVLELIVMKSILDSDDLNELALGSNVNDLLKDFRFVYIETDKGWEAHYEEIMTINTEKLNDDGKIILIIGGDRMAKAIIDQSDIEEVLDNISNANPSEYIDNANRINDKKFPIIHWLSLHDQCIFQKRDHFEEWKPVRHAVKNLELLKRHYKPYLISRSQNNE